MNSYLLKTRIIFFSITCLVWGEWALANLDKVNSHEFIIRPDKNHEKITKIQQQGSLEGDWIETEKQNSFKDSLQNNSTLLTNSRLDNSNRIKSYSWRGLPATHLNMSLGSMELGESFMGSRPWELIPLEDFKNGYLTATPGLRGSLGAIVLNDLKQENKISLSQSSIENQKAHFSIFKAMKGEQLEESLNIKLNYENRDNKQKIWNHYSESFEDIENDNEKFYSFQIKTPSYKGWKIHYLQSGLQQGVWGSLKNLYKDIAEEKNIYIASLKSKHRYWGSFAIKPELSFKKYETDLSDKTYEVSPSIFNHHQNFNTFLLHTKAKYLSKNFLLRGEINFSNEGLDSFENKALKGKYKRQGIKESLSGGTKNHYLTVFGNHFDEVGNNDKKSNNYYGSALNLNFSKKYLYGKFYFQLTPSLTQKAPTLIQKFGNSGLYKGNKELRNETWKTLALKTSYENKSLSISLRPYMTRSDELIAYIRSSFGYWIPINIKKSKLSGIENSIEYKWFINSLFKAGKVKLNATLLKSINNRGIYRHNSLPGIIEKTANIGISQNISDFIGTYTLYYQGPFYLDEGNFLQAPGFTLHHFDLSYFYKSWKIGLKLFNIFNIRKGTIESDENLFGTKVRALQGPNGNFVSGRTLTGELNYVF